jgi:biflaviolin synthase
MGAYFSELIGLREGSTDEDVTSLLGAAVGRGELTLEEAADFAVHLQIGGEAVTGNGGQMLYVLLTRPELERLRAEPIHVSYLDVSFGLGPYYRPGGTLARLVSELLMDALLDGVPGLRLAVPAEEVPFKKGALVRGPEALPVTW